MFVFAVCKAGATGCRIYYNAVFGGLGGDSEPGGDRQVREAEFVGDVVCRYGFRPSLRSTQTS